MGHSKQGQGACGSGCRIAKSDLGDSGYNSVKRVLPCTQAGEPAFSRLMAGENFGSSTIGDRRGQLATSDSDDLELRYPPSAGRPSEWKGPPPHLPPARHQAPKLVGCSCLLVDGCVGFAPFAWMTMWLTAPARTARGVSGRDF
jgi:hypothetical protein